MEMTMEQFMELERRRQALPDEWKNEHEMIQDYYLLYGVDIRELLRVKK